MGDELPPVVTAVPEAEPQLRGMALSGPIVWNLVAGLLPALAIGPLLFGQAMHLWADPKTQLGVLVWLFVAVVVSATCRSWQLTQNHWRIAIAIAANLVASVCFAVGVMQWQFEFVQAAAAIFLVAWGLVRCGQQAWYEVFGWGCLLAITIPVPGLYTDLDRWLTETAGQMSSQALDSRQIPNLLEDSVLYVKQGQVAISSVLSHRVSLYAVICCTAIGCWFRSASMLHCLLLFMVLPLWVMAGRFGAMLATTYGLTHYQDNWAMGQAHYWIAGGAILGIMLLLICSDRVVAAMLRPVPMTDPETLPIFAAANELMIWPKEETFVLELPQDPDEQAELQSLQVQSGSKVVNELDLRWGTRWHATAALTISGLLLVSGLVASLVAISVSGLVPPKTVHPNLDLQPFAAVVDDRLFPQRLDSFELLHVAWPERDVAMSDSESTKGRLAVQVDYRWSGLMVQVHLKAPQLEWQPPEIKSRIAKAPIIQLHRDADAQSAWPWYWCQYVNDLGGHNYLWQCGLQDDLKPCPVRQTDDSAGLPLISRLTADNQLGNSGRLIYEIFVFCESGERLTAQQIDDLQIFFATIRKSIQSRLVSGMLQNAAVN
ncbi:MAG: exosortase/archaeosortase family protein [Pirellulaceae bacterium]|nr:exosortase/archaeosortase family protein [Pirellulaceae bacterium]